MTDSRIVCSTTLSLLLLALIGHPLAFAQPRFLRYKCVDGGYNNRTTDGAAYKANLNHLFSTLTTDHQIDYGFYNFSYGAGENRANVIGLCRGDISVETCRKCLNDSTDLLPVRCPTQREAIGWHENCMLRYSDRPILGSMELSPSILVGHPFNASNPEGFTQAARKLILSLIDQASAGDSRVKFSTGNITLPNLPTIYAFAQCTPDLSQRQCNECFVGALPKIHECCDGKLEARVLTPSCQFRYGAYSVTQSPPSTSLLPSPVPPLLNKSTHHGNKNKTSETFIAVVVPIALVVVLSLTIIIYMGLRKSSPKPDEEECPTEEETTTMGLLQFDFDSIKMATDEFSDENKVGEGGFGSVYKGKLPNGRIVAVKRLSQASRQGVIEFKNELLLVSKLHHRNLVKLLGFSFKENEKSLIYEFLYNGSLQNFIFDPLKRQSLDWATRYKIIEDIVRGLIYLHEDSRIKIIHRNLKASNILLDVEMNAKISDFGIARLFASEQTQTNTSTIIGTCGYMAPEYIRHGYLSSKSDVFSFGVLLLEIVTGQKNNRILSNVDNIEDPLISYAWRNWREGTPLNIVDPSIEVQREIRNKVTRCIHIGLLCIQEKVDERPKMTTVLLMLNGDLTNFPNPSQPSFFMNDRTQHNRS
ncbi:cysteine-rich receptor-like protein kinase 29 isoform X2 [Benincasa hispida]|uniref:cysteine-rich receptor-like protein kinase 29 isoform X2 n=1 Tax=Benincasa hispida TaxID=102211 RepID=UPI001901C8C1|nr:cysteine-rich receptor-like protein kinase 29 isoform X2 [Benincasa hispida]